MIHPGPTEDTPFKILDILESSGADTSHTVIAHLDRTICNDQTLLKLAQRGCYLEFDLFGTECSHYQVKMFHFPLLLSLSLTHTHTRTHNSACPSNRFS